MANYAAGVSVSWNGVAFSEVTSLKFTHGNGLPISRGGDGAPLAVDMGSIEVVCLGAANCSLANYGQRATFAVSGGGASFTHKAIYEKLAVEDKVNDVRRYTVTLRFSPA